MASSDADAQFRWARAYMQERYGTQAAALKHEAPADWYTAGGFLPPITTADS